MPPMGVLVVDKPRGMTSRKVVAAIGRMAGAAKSGHAGTLDPLATGVLVVCLGRATLLSSYLARGTKAYLVTCILGLETDTYDIEGRETARADASSLTRKRVADAAGVLTGVFEQVPPPFSAVKHQGKPLYQYARQGTTLDAGPRRVTVDSIEVLSLGSDEEGVKVGLRVTCGPGTYVRSLVHDMGRDLGCGATVAALRRVRSGDFDIDRAIDFERLAAGKVAVQEVMMTMEDATAALLTVTLKPEGALPVGQGKPLEVAWVASGVSGERLSETARVLDGTGRLLALYGSPRATDGPEVAGRAVRVVRASTLGTDDDETAQAY